LIPADEHGDLCITRLKARKSKIARGEIEFLVVQRIVRNMHLAIFARQRSVRVDHHCRVVVNARRTPLKKRRDDDNLFFPGKIPKRVGARARDGFRELEIPMIFALAKVARAKQLLETNNLCAFFAAASMRCTVLASWPQDFTAAHRTRPTLPIRGFYARHDGCSVADLTKKQKGEEK
jgi:hypothetical protein